MSPVAARAIQRFAGRRRRGACDHLDGGDVRCRVAEGPLKARGGSAGDCHVKVEHRDSTWWGRAGRQAQRDVGHDGGGGKEECEARKNEGPAGWWDQGTISHGTDDPVPVCSSAAILGKQYIGTTGSKTHL